MSRPDARLGRRFATRGGRHRVVTRPAIAVCLAALAVLVDVRPPAGGRQAGAHHAVAYRPPVEGTVVDGFRRPVHRYAAGNRGVDYATDFGAAVRAAGAGVVSFAGRVGNGVHVTVLHPDGIRTTYAFLAGAAVRRGERVEAGQVVGRSSGRFHFGARVGRTYIDPRLLYDFRSAPGQGRGRARLVPDRPSAPPGSRGEKARSASTFAS